MKLRDKILDKILTPIWNPLEGKYNPLSFNVTLSAAGSYTLGLSVHPGKTSIINWGDGASTTVTYSEGDYQNQVHSYSAAGTYTIIVTNSESIKGIRHTSTTNGNIWFNLSSIPNATFVAISGSNTVSGNLSSIPNATFVYIWGSNTVSGNLSSIPNATTVSISGSNTVSGNLSSVPNATTVAIGGFNTVSDYTIGTLWPTSMRNIYMRQATGYGFSSAEVDNLLIDLAARVTTWTIEKSVDLRGVNAARTAASDAAVATITSRGAVVYTN